MTLLERVHRALADQRIKHAVIGAAALATHGVSRSTLDVDLLVHGRRCLLPPTWRDVEAAGGSVDIRRGDADDPLAGVIHLEARAERPIDVVVGRSRWQHDVIERAVARRFDGFDVPVVRAPDLVLLKLYAGGPQDRWDIAQLLSGRAARAIAVEVDREIAKLPARCRLLWREIRPA